MTYEATSAAGTEAAPPLKGYRATRARVEAYFDGTATRTWERLTSDAPVSRIRATVRAGRDEMRALLLSGLPADLRGARILDAGCGTGQMTQALAERGGEVTAVDISPALVDIARKRLPDALVNQVRFQAGDMLDPSLGNFDYVVAMDSLIYYTGSDIGRALAALERRVSQSTLFTIAPRTTLLMAMWYAGKMFPRADRSPIMIPHARTRLAEQCQAAGTAGHLKSMGRVSCGFYISEALEFGA